MLDQQPPGTISCLFCSGIIPVNAGSYKFENHMKSIHDIFKNFDILFSLHFLIESEREAVIASAQNRIATLKSESLSEEENSERESNGNNCNDVIEYSVMKNSANEGQKFGSEPCGKDMHKLKDKIQFLKKEKIKIKEKIHGQKVLLSTKFSGTKEEKKLQNDKKEIEKFEIEDIGGAEISFMCENCNKIFKDKYKLKRHIERKSRCYNKEILECTKCNKTFKFYFQLRDHKCGSAKSKAVIECEKCKKGFRDNNTYKKHMNRKFSCLKKILKCDKCDRKFRDNEVFETHIMKNYNCKLENWRVDDAVGGK